MPEGTPWVVVGLRDDDLDGSARGDLLRRQLAAKCGSPGAGTTLAFQPRPGSGQILVTGTFDREFGRRIAEMTDAGRIALRELARQCVERHF